MPADFNNIYVSLNYHLSPQKFDYNANGVKRKPILYDLGSAWEH